MRDARKTMLSRSVSVMIVLLSTIGCVDRSATSRGPDDSTKSPSPSDIRSRVGNDTVAVLIERLRELAGTFPSSQSVGGEFTGDRELLVRLAEYKDSAVVKLVDCLDRTDSARATAEGQPVRMGVMCYLALSHTVSYEAADSKGDLDERWPGLVAPLASPNDLRLAKEAWKKVVAERRYTLIRES
jgi:hypothetical protein